MATTDNRGELEKQAAQFRHRQDVCPNMSILGASEPCEGCRYLAEFGEQVQQEERQRCAEIARTRFAYLPELASLLPDGFLQACEAGNVIADEILSGAAPQTKEEA